jgi:hypothetical protein
MQMSRACSPRTPPARRCDVGFAEVSNSVILTDLNDARRVPPDRPGSLPLPDRQRQRDRQRLARANGRISHREDMRTTVTMSGGIGRNDKGRVVVMHNPALKVERYHAQPE